MAKNKKIILRELFYIGSAALVVFIILELAKPNIVQTYININYLLVAWILLGIALIISHNKFK